MVCWYAHVYVYKKFQHLVVLMETLIYTVVIVSKLLFFLIALYIFEALNGKPVGDGKPVKHTVRFQCVFITLLLFYLFELGNNKLT